MPLQLSSHVQGRALGSSSCVRGQARTPSAAVSNGVHRRHTRHSHSAAHKLGARKPSLPSQHNSIAVRSSLIESLTGFLKPQPKKDAPKKAGAKTVFVAGSTGRVGARIVRELLDLGYSVRAGARNVESAQESIDVAETYGLLTSGEVGRVEVVPFDLKDRESIKEAIGGAQSVVCAVGAPESDALNPGAPKAIDGDGTISLIKEASAAGVERFILISSLGTGKVGWPASILNLFWGVLIWKREAEKALEGSGMTYTILRPGGMERPTDAYKETHNMKLSPRDTTFGGNVSRLQVAELVAGCLDNPDLAANKVLEVTAETTAPELTVKELLQAASGIKSDVTVEAQSAARAASKDSRAAAATGDKRLSAARDELDMAMDRVQAANASLAEAKDNEAEVKAKAGGAMKDAAEVEATLSQARKEVQEAVQAEATARMVLEETKKQVAQNNGQALSPQQLKAVRDSVAAKQRSAAAAAPPVPKVAPKVTPPPPAAVPKLAPKVAPAAAPVAAAPAQAPMPPPGKKEEKKKGGFFGGLFGGGDAIELDVGADSDSQKIRVPQKGEDMLAEAPVQAAAPPAPKAAAPPAAKAAPPPPPPQAAAAPPAPKAAPAAPKPPGPPVESAEEVEKRMMEAIAEDRRQKALADAKAKMDKEAKAIEAARIANAKANPQPPPPPPPPAKKAAPPPPPAAKQAAAPAPASSAVLANKVEAQKWIANWQQKQKGGAAAAGAPSSNGTPAASSSPSSDQVAWNKKDAQQWIANWQVKQGKAPAMPAAAPAPPANDGRTATTNPAKIEAQEWIARWRAKQPSK